MKKQIAFLLILSVFALPMVSAGNLFGHQVSELQLHEKNPADWSIVEDGAYGIVEFSVVNTPWKILQERMKVEVHGLEPKTSYQLIYYGDETHNDVWNYATCIGEPKTTSTQGYFKSGSTRYNFIDMMNDDIPQKFWVVLSSDVDCEQGKMTKWRPTEYLFEHNTI